LPVPEQSPDYRDLSNWVVLRVLDAIRDGSIKSGERLVERDVAARFGVSRAPVRDAFHKLESLGVIERKPPRGVQVRSWSETDAAEILLLADALIYLSVQLAAEQISDAEIAELERILDQTAQMVESGSTDAATHLRLDLGFHLIIARAAGNKRLLELLESLILPLEIYPDPFKVRIDPHFSLRQHKALLATLKARDRKAAVQCVLANFEEGIRESKYRFASDAVRGPATKPEPVSG
jgi:DNA-binding GntR family transcriptional regulator